MKKLTVLSFGGGQDSTAILYKLAYDNEFRSKYAPGDLIVIMADTANEHDETRQHVREIHRFCNERDIPFFHLSTQWATGDWQHGLIGFYRAGNRIGSKAFPKTCTDKLKVQPIYKFLEHYVHDTYQTEKFGRKAALREFCETNDTKIDVLIGIARGEERRLSKNEDSPSAWQRDCINKVYPLVDLGMDRQDCQDYITSVGHEVPLPSNCILCPFMNKQELLYLKRFMPQWFDKWVELEHNKLKANLHMGEKNAGVWGRKTLPEVLAEAEQEYGHMSDEELREYKMSHGHCVMSKY